MKKRTYRLYVMMLAVMLSVSIVGQPAAAQEPIQKQSGEKRSADSLPLEENGVTVGTYEDFMRALAEKKSPITVNGTITIGDKEDADKRLMPVQIPANTLIQGGAKGNLVCRSPIQLEGDVEFKNIELNFTSTDGMGNTPHREIFLAGHGLTLDDVSTWQKGGGGTSGDLLGSEKELLPTVYGGGFTGSQVGTNASLTVRNSNDKTMFAAIYMGHDAQNDQKVPYTGTAKVNLDAKAVVRGSVDVSKNSQAQITVSGGEYDSAKVSNFSGNAHTTLTVSGCLLSGAIITEVGNLMLKDGACLKMSSSKLHHVTLQNGACLDLNGADGPDVQITGDFSGVENSQEKRGILVVNQQKTLHIEGQVRGTTQFQTYDRLFPGRFLLDHPYITANQASEDCFVLAQESAERGYELHFVDGTWSVSNPKQGDVLEVGSIEILSHPSWAVVNQIEAAPELADGTIPIPNESMYFEIVWKDLAGAKLSAQEVEENQLYYPDYFILIKSEYWESDEPEILQKNDWGNLAVDFVTSERYPDRYFLQAQEGAPLGAYTFLFFSDYYGDDFNTVQDVKNLKGLIKAECNVSFLDKEPEPAPPEEGETPNPPGGEEETPNPPGEGETPNPPDNEEKPPSQPGGSETPGQPGGAETPIVPKPEPPSNPPQTQPPSDLPEQPDASQNDPTVDGSSDQDAADGSEQPAVHQHAYRITVTKATLKKNGTVLKKCSCGKIQTKQVIYYPKKVSLSAASMRYTGKARKPSVTVKDQKGKVISSKNYKVSYKNNTKVGSASVTITFRGNYSGKITKYFEITPPPTALTKATPKARGFSLKWKKQGAQISGYELQYSTSRKFEKKATKTLTVKSSRTTTKTISRQKARKKYYLRIRTYRNVKIGGKTKRLYSEWSKVKTVTTGK